MFLNFFFILLVGPYSTTSFPFFFFWNHFISSDEYNFNPALEWDDEFPGRWHGSLAQFNSTPFFLLLISHEHDPFSTNNFTPFFQLVTWFFGSLILTAIVIWFGKGSST